jgi:acetyl esterase/lipase
MTRRLLFCLLLPLVLSASGVAAVGCGSSGQPSGVASSTPAAGPAQAGPGIPMGEGGAAAGEASPSQTGAGAPAYSDVAYATKSPSEKLDIYLPSGGAKPYPVIVTIHGGAFAMGDKADGQQTPMLAALDRGYAVVPVDYRLSGEAQFPAAVQDVKAAIRYLRANAAKYGLDAQRIAVWGDSAGGNLAAMVGTSAGVKAFEDASLGNASQSDAVQAVVDWFGPIDFGTMDAQFEKSGSGPANHSAADSPESRYLGAELASVPEKVKASDPATYVSAEDPPVLIEHGTADPNVPVEQSKEFAAALTRVLGPDKVTIKLLPGAGHMDPAFMTQENIGFCLDWLDAHLK